MRTAKKLFQAVCADLHAAPGSWGPDLDAEQFSRIHLLNNVVRKFEGDAEVPPAALALAISKFNLANAKSALWSPGQTLNTSLDEIMLGEFNRALHSFFSVCGDAALINDNVLEHFFYGRPGPGASIGTKHTDYLHKMFDSRISITSGLLPYWHYCTTSEAYEPLSNAFFFAREQWGLEVVAGSKLSVVPKTVDVGRAIATEPSANMWMQRGLSHQIEAGLRYHFGIDLSNQQDKNRLMAQRGSVSDDLVTLDLESASDSISLGLLESFPEWFRVLVMAYRSPSVEVEKQSVKLNMISTMGNGFTFSLMTLIMSCVVSAVAEMSGVKLTRWRHSRASSRLCDDSLPDTLGNWGVFGDDIICPSSISRRVQRLLTLLGFTVNATKSFVEGPFRESCGGDYFRGVDVRPVFIKHLESRADLFVAFNSLARWSAQHEVPLDKTLRLLLKWMRGAARSRVPLHCNDDSGIKVPQRLLETHHLRDGNGSLYYHQWTPCPVLVVVDPTVDAKGQGRSRSRCRNMSGIMQALLFGAIRGGTLSIRQDRRQLVYRSTRGVTPSWDTSCHTVGRFGARPGQLVAVLEPLLH